MRFRTLARPTFYSHLHLPFYLFVLTVLRFFPYICHSLGHIRERHLLNHSLSVESLSVLLPRSRNSPGCQFLVLGPKLCQSVDRATEIRSGTLEPESDRRVGVVASDIFRCDMQLDRDTLEPCHTHRVEFILCSGRGCDPVVHDFAIRDGWVVNFPGKKEKNWLGEVEVECGINEAAVTKE